MCLSKVRFLFITFLLIASIVSIAGARTVNKANDDFVVVIDAGHGGKDYGCIGDKANEKTITLDVSKRLAEKIKEGCKDTKVVMTRSDDSFVSLQKRADIANKADGTLFISIHVNSVDKKNRSRRSISGASVYAVGPDKDSKTLQIAMRENAVIELEDDFTEKYSGFDPSSAESYIIFELSNKLHNLQSLEFAKLAQRELVNTAGRADKGVRQAGFWVLWATTMPSVLVELDFICNPNSEKFLNSDKGREKCAEALFQAFKKYQNNYNIAKNTK